jgi:hypothetical protein
MKQKGEGKVLILGLIVVLSVVFLALGQEGDEWDWEAAFANLRWAAPVYRGAIIGVPELVTWHPNGVGVGDFNEDGRQDLVVSTFNLFARWEEGEIAGRITILLANEEGGFTVFSRGVFNYCLESPEDWLIGAILVSDLNEDGHLDLIFRVNGKIVALLGDGRGGVSEPRTLESEGYLSRRLVLSDFNEDGHVDVACADPLKFSVAVYIGNGTGGFLSPTFHRTRGIPATVASGDFDGDGHVDLVAVEAADTEVLPTGGVAILLGNGEGEFGEPIVVGVLEHPFDVAVGDVDADSHLDLAVLHSTWPCLVIVLSDGNGGFLDPLEHPLPEYGPTFLDTGDFDEDGCTDVVVAFMGSSESMLLLSDGEGRFARSVDFWTGYVASSVTVLDIDQDGHLDVVIAAVQDQLVSVANGDGRGHLGATWFQPSPEPPPSGFSWRRVRSEKMGDFNEDGHVDFIGSSWEKGHVYLMLGDREKMVTEAPGSPFPVARHLNEVSAGDFNEDGHLDAAACNDGTVHILFGNGRGDLGLPVSLGVGESPWDLVAGDFNEDGHLDIITANWGSKDLSCLLGDGRGDFTPAPKSPLSLGEARPEAITFGDFNNDGHLDLVTANGSEMNLALLIGNGNGTFLEPLFLYVGGKPFAVATGDFDGDGNLDLVVGNFRNTRTILLGNGKGGFSYMAVFSDWRELYLPLVVRDYDGDGDLDFFSDITFLNTMEGYPEEGVRK